MMDASEKPEDGVSGMADDAAAKYGELLRVLEKRGSVRVAELARDLFLSESTVRRALDALEEQGRLKRFHGGAALTDPVAQSQVHRRQISHLAEKDAIGRMAATFVKDGMTLLMMGGTTVHAVCPYLKGMRLTVITSSLPVMNELAWEEKITVILLGGVLNPSEMEVRGGLTHLALERLRADLMLTGTTGLHPIHGLMTDDPNGVETYQACMRISDQVIVLADHSKCEQYEGTTVFCPLSEINCLITDGGLSESVRAYFEKHIPRLCIAQAQGG
jgi:DeoR/GlpR family transcriptional regulator of sugar metabolism